MTVDEAADMLAVGRSKIYQLVADGELDAVKIGKCIRIIVASLDRLLAKCFTNDL
ncbi:helix-turn-helix domain-containing protein [Sphingopyxis fribergensis]